MNKITQQEPRKPKREALEQHELDVRHRQEWLKNRENGEYCRLGLDRWMKEILFTNIYYKYYLEAMALPDADGP